MKVLKPLFPYMGSKTPVREELSQLMASRSHETYIEPFVGSAAVFYAKHKAKINVLNDVDPEVINIHAAIAAAA